MHYLYKKTFIFVILQFILLYYGFCQEYQMMYEPLFPSGSGRMNIDTANTFNGPYYPPQGSDFFNNMNFYNTFTSPPNINRVETPKNETKNNTNILPGLEGTLCVDLYKECPDYKDNQYCEKYRKQMLFQCRKSCGFCYINPFNENNYDTNEEEEESGSGYDDNSGTEEKNTSDTLKRSVIEKNEELVEDSDELLNEDEKHFNAMKSRFKMPGFVPSLEDLYAEVGTLHPSLRKKASRDVLNTGKRTKINDPFKYLRHKASSSSIQPIVDRSALSSSRVQRSNPVYIFKTSRSIISSKTKRSIEEPNIQSYIVV